MARFRGRGGEFERMRALQDRRQQQGESVEEYFRAMSRLGNRLLRPISEAEMVKIVKKGLTAEIARFVYALRVYSVEQLREECLEVEDAFMRRDIRPAYRGPSKFQSSGRQVEEVAADAPEGEAETEEPVVEEISRHRIVCWNCGRAEHGFRDFPSPKRKIFCPNCAGNGRTSAGKVGDQRSTFRPNRS